MQHTQNTKLLEKNDPEVYATLTGEEIREFEGLELIPSENYTYPEVFAANGSILTNKYAEGYPGRRYYGGQTYTDQIESLAISRAKKLFQAEHANVQPLSGSPMNQAVYLGFLSPGDTVLGMDLSHGGHLTHGAPVSHMGKIFNFIRYKTHPEDAGRIDESELMTLAAQHKPRLILCGYTSYPRDLDYAMFKRVADSVGALTMADVSHIGGLIAAGVMRNPLHYGFDIVTTTTHKTLRGPRAGLILCKKEHAPTIDKSVFPGLQGGPHMHTIAAIAVTLGKALQPDFKTYAKQVLVTSQSLAESLLSNGVSLITGGTENHMLVANTIKSFNLNGAQAEKTLDQVGITVNKQIIPDDLNPPLTPSGIRLGTPCATTRGMTPEDMHRIGTWIVQALRHHNDPDHLQKIHQEVKLFCQKYPIPGI